jgi:glucosamine--fructose-6-phosphate aminotransferase (isomerizing)
MCGIFGYIGSKNAAPSIVLGGLKSLEYRGYDSWGIAAISQKDEPKQTIVVKKRIGKIGSATTDDIPASTLAIGHTRWATHGGVTELNSHPHMDCTGSIAIIHNGIVENYAELKNMLKSEGHTFVSETDSEIIAHLIEQYAKTETFEDAFSHAFEKLIGFNAVIAISTAKRSIMAVRNGSPLVLGFGNHEQFLASDASALLPYTREVYFLHDKEIVRLTDTDIQSYDVATKSSVTLLPTHIEWSQASAEKNGFPNFMLKEIHEQPDMIERIIAGSHDEHTTLASMIKNARGAYLVACGSAFYAATAGSYLFSKVAKRHINTAVGSEFSYEEDFVTDKSLIIALSQSGETMDTLEAIRTAKKHGAKTAAIVNAIGSSLEREVDFSLPITAGPEKAVASTKAVTGKISHLLLLSHILANRYEEGIDVLKKAKQSMLSVLTPKTDTIINAIANTLVEQKHIYVIGRGLSYPAALETALKIKEISYIHAEGFAAGELKHGVIALIEPGTPCIAFLPNDETYGANLSGAMEMKARGGKIIGVSHAPHEIFDEYIEVPDAGVGTVIANIVVAQLLAYHLTIAKKLDPDMPRNLAKSVTVK